MESQNVDFLSLTELSQETRSLAEIDRDFSRDLNNDFSSLSSCFNYLRKKAVDVKAKLEIRAKRGQFIDGAFLHDVLNVGNLKHGLIPLFTPAEREREQWKPSQVFSVIKRGARLNAEKRAAYIQAQSDKVAQIEADKVNAWKNCSPAAVALMRNNGIDAYDCDIVGTGKDGRIVKSDVVNYLAAQ